MQSDRNSKRCKLTQDIRRRQIDSFMTECRSKMLVVWQRQVQRDRCQLLHAMLPEGISEFDKLKRFMEALVKRDDDSMKEEGTLCIDADKIRRLVTLREDCEFSIKPANQQYWLSTAQLCDCLSFASKEICTTTENLNKDLHRIGKIIVVNQVNKNLLEQLLAKIYQVTNDLREIVGYCNMLLHACSQLLCSRDQVLLNKKIVEQVTSCLIELSCFRPRKYSNGLNLPFITEINKIMQVYRESLNVPTTKQLLIIAKFYVFDSFNFKILTNSIYILGNVYVSLSSPESSGKELYQQVHQLAFGIFKHVLKNEGASMPETGSGQQRSREEVSELFSLMAWFIRNEILIVEGMFQALESMKLSSETQVKTLDQDWLEISFFVLSNIWSWNMNHNTKDLPEPEATIIADILSLLRLLDNDFNLDPKDLLAAFKLIYPFTNSLNLEKASHLDLQAQIYQFYIDFLNTKFNQSDISHINPAPHLLIYNEVKTIMHRQRLTAAGLRLSSKVINPQHCLKDPHMLEVYQQVCANFESVLKLVENKGQYEEVREFISLAQSVIGVFEVMNYRTSMQIQFLSEQMLVDLLKLCEVIWSSEKNIDDIVKSLRLLRTIADNEHLSNLLKIALVKQGHLQQLESLSAHPNPDINLLIYQIYELLQLE